MALTALMGLTGFMVPTGFMVLTLGRTILVVGRVLV
jgi:hypothetical protein